MTGTPEPTKTASSSGGLNDLRGGRGQVHVYDAKGKWLGQFMDETVAVDWASAHGHTDVSRVRPVKGKKPVTS